MNKLLILGGSGFLGSNLLRHFVDKYEVYGHEHNNLLRFEHPNITKVYGDLTKKNDVRRLLRDKDVVIQAAATTSGAADIVNRPEIHVTDNAVMNSYVFRYAHELGVKHVIFPSCTVMYEPMSVPQKEDDWDANKDIYDTYFGVGNTKVYLEKMCEFYSRLGKTKFTAIRHSNIYGPYDKFDLQKSHVFGATVRKVDDAEDKGTIEVWGDGKASRDLLYVDDLCRFIQFAIDRQPSPYELMNCGYGKVHSIREIVNLVKRAFNKNLIIKYDESKPNIPTTVKLDCQKAKDLIGWSPLTHINDGVKQTIEWYKENE